LFYDNNKNLIKNISDNDKSLIIQSDLSKTFTKDNIENNNVEGDNKKIIYLKCFLDYLVNFLIQKYEEIEVAIEILLFISFIANQDEIMKTILEKNKDFFLILNEIININSVKLIIK